ncbi:hypothetical protein B0H19DRAFT_524400 [Mycena capillaripes]|nr:hypothetical protein B0H19DRAFT_524400 [Mycena capillaripes]
MSLLTALLDFLLEPAPQDVTDPHTLPPSLNNLPNQVYIDAALTYVVSYPFERNFMVYIPQRIQEKTLFTPGSTWQKKSRALLKVCISTDRCSLASLSSEPESYDPSKHQLDFLRNHIIKRRWTLEEVASEMRAFLRLIPSRTPIVFWTPMPTSLPKRKSVVDQIRERDNDKCRLTGVEHDKQGSDAEQEAREAPTDSLKVVHCLPFKTGNTSFELIESLAGIKMTSWHADNVENAFLTRPTIYHQFGFFRIFFECIRTTEGEEIIIRGRIGAASPRASLRGLLNDCG